MNKEEKQKIIKELIKEILKMENDNLYIRKAGLKDKIKSLIKGRIK